MGCVLAMKAALLLSREDENCRITVYSDSQLIVNQFIGQYAIKKPEFKPYYNKATGYKSNMPKGCFNGILWVRRELNKDADRMSKVGSSMEKKTLKKL
jgi:ribonuclease HI